MTRQIEFSKRTVYETEGRNQGPVFEEGSRHDLRDDIAERFVRRGVATYVDSDAPAEPPQARPAPAKRTRLPGAADVEIPDDWRKLAAADVKDLAAALAEPAPANRNEAHEIVEAELAAREKTLV